MGSKDFWFDTLGNVGRNAGQTLSNSRVTESSSELSVSESIRGTRGCIMNTTANRDSSDLPVFFFCSCLRLPHVGPFFSSPLISQLCLCYFHTPPSHFDFHTSSCFALLLSSPWRSPSHPSVPYHYYEPSGPDECSMYLSHERSKRGSHHRFITEKTVFANWALTLNIHFYQPDWEPAAVTTSMNDSFTAAPAGSWHSLQIWRVGYVCGQFPACWFPLWPIWVHETATGQSKLLLWLLADCLSSLAERDHCIMATQRHSNVLEV